MSAPPEGWLRVEDIIESPDGHPGYIGFVLLESIVAVDVFERHLEGRSEGWIVRAGTACGRMFRIDGPYYHNVADAERRALEVCYLIAGIPA